MTNWLVPWICRARWCGGRQIEPYLAPPTSPPYPERNDDEFLKSLDLPTRNRFLHQQAIEAQFGREFDPVTDSNVQEFPLGALNLDFAISTSYRSVIFRSSETVIKYSHNCGMRDEVHPILTNAWEGALASRSGYAPIVYYVSTPRRMVREDFDFFGFDMRDEDIAECLLGNPSVRYLVMELFDGMTLANSCANIGITEFLMIGRNLFEALKSIHESGIMHGDLKEEHVMIDKSFNVRLIDFGTKPSDDLTVKSPWEIKREPYGFRDDVFRAIRIMASILNQCSAYIKHEKRILDNIGVAGLMEWKLESNFFFIPDTPDPFVRVIGSPSRPSVRIATRLTQFLVSQVSSMDEQLRYVPYAEIVFSFTQTEKHIEDESFLRVRFDKIIQKTPFLT